jgi:hypothetical protein
VLQAKSRRERKIKIKGAADNLNGQSQRDNLYDEIEMILGMKLNFAEQFS